jgi:undecaprenyl-diphosphatase
MEQHMAQSRTAPAAGGRPAASREATALLALLAVALAAALALTIAVIAEDPLPGDVRVLREVSGWPFPRGLADAVRAVTMTQVVVACGYVAAGALFLCGGRREGLALAGAMLVLPLLQAGLKDLVDRPRPTPEIVAQRAGHSSESFPSGHVMSPMVLYGYVLWQALSDRLPLPLRVLRWPVAAWSAALLALTGFVSVWLGVHWPSDVLGGYAWGAVLALAAVIAATSRWPRRPV